jgi:hypothetical protein
MGEQKPQDTRAWATVMIAVATIGCIGVIVAALINTLPEIIKATSPVPSMPTNIVIPSSAPVQNLATVIPTFAPIPATSIPSSDDTRDIAAQTLGYANLDGFMSAFGIPTEVKSRIFVCPNEETWCLGVYEEPGQVDFHFKNITNCTIDGKQANGTSTIPSGFDGMVKGFTVRLCSR